MFEKPKNRAPSQGRNMLLIGMGAGLLALIVVAGLFWVSMPRTVPDQPTALPPTAVSLLDEEMMIVPLNTASPTYSMYEYKGSVTLLVKGFGQVNNRQYSDAFYTFLTAQQEPLAPPIMQADFMLEIDGESAATLLQLNPVTLPYSSTHTYLVRYNVGMRPRKIALRTTDRSVEDNTGQLQVRILTDASGIPVTYLPSFPPTPAPTPQSYEATEGGEMVVIPFTSGSPVYTQTLYSGIVTLLIRGTGQAGGEDYSDAFYLYEYPDHSPYIPPILGDFHMELDGGKIHEVLNFAPEYSPYHVYRVNYDVGPKPRKIGFRNTDLTTGDNTGTYYVEVIPGG